MGKFFCAKVLAHSYNGKPVHIGGVEVDIEILQLDGKVDIKYFFSSQKADGSYVYNTQYDQKGMIQLNKMLVNYDSRPWYKQLLGIGQSDVKVKNIFYNDSDIININKNIIRYLIDHDDHEHIEFLLNNL